MKKLKLLIPLIISFVFIIGIIPCAVYAEVSDKCAVYDYIDCFSSDERESLDLLIKGKAEEIDFDIAVVFTDQGPYIPDSYTDDEVSLITKEYADDVYDSLFVNDGYRGGIVLVVDYDHSFFSISTGLKNKDEYQSYIDSFTEDLRPLLRSHDSYAATVKFIENADIKAYKTAHYIKCFTIGGIISLVITLITCLGISISYKKHDKYSSRHYLINRESRFIVNNDQFIRQYVTKSKIESSSSSSSRGGGSGGSHSSHGGGGSRI